MRLVEINDRTVNPPMKWYINPKQICCIHKHRITVKGKECVHYTVKLCSGDEFIVSEEDCIRLIK